MIRISADAYGPGKRNQVHTHCLIRNPICGTAVEPHSTMDKLKATAHRHMIMVRRCVRTRRTSPAPGGLRCSAVTESSYLGATRAAYDAVAVKYAEFFRTALDGLPLDRAL